MKKIAVILPVLAVLAAGFLCLRIYTAAHADFTLADGVRWGMSSEEINGIYGGSTAFGRDGKIHQLSMFSDAGGDTERDFFFFRNNELVAELSGTAYAEHNLWKSLRTLLGMIFQYGIPSGLSPAELTACLRSLAPDSDYAESDFGDYGLYKWNAGKDTRVWLVLSPGDGEMTLYLSASYSAGDAAE